MALPVFSGWLAGWLTISNALHVIVNVAVGGRVDGRF